MHVGSVATYSLIASVLLSLELFLCDIQLKVIKPRWQNMYRIVNDVFLSFIRYHFRNHSHNTNSQFQPRYSYGNQIKQWDQLSYEF